MQLILDTTYFSDYHQLIIYAVIIAFSQIIYSVLGFGSGMFAISILAYLFGDLEFIVPFFTILCLPTEAIISYKDRKLINFRDTKIFLIIILPFLFIGSFLLTKATEPIYLVFLGIIVFLLAMYYLFGAEQKKMKLNSKFWTPFFGSISGLLGGLFGMAGPPLIFFFKHKNISKREFRVALLSIFLVMTIARLFFYFVLNILSIKLLITSLSMIPFSILGLIIGNYVHQIVSEHKFKIITSIALAISGILIIAKNFGSIL